MAKQSPIVDRNCEPMCRVINGTPMPPTQAKVNKYIGDSMVNTEPGNTKMRAMKSTAEYPEYVLPKGSTL